MTTSTKLSDKASSGGVYSHQEVRTVDERSRIAMQLQEFIENNKDRIIAKSEANTKRNENGDVVISRDDEWFYEDVWDELYAELLASDQDASR